jgi:hypothetical protein
VLSPRSPRSRRHSTTCLWHTPHTPTAHLAHLWCWLEEKGSDGEAGLAWVSPVWSAKAEAMGERRRPAPGWWGGSRG